MKETLKLNLGCWKRDIPGFTNVDICDMPHIHYKHGVDTLPMFKDNSADLIYASHVFEYFDRQKGAEVLKEWFRVLSPGGTLRIAVPNFTAIVWLYKETLDIQKCLGMLYGRMEIDTPNGKEVLYHKTTYDIFSLGKMLEDAGFVNVRTYDWREAEHADIDDHSQSYYPHMQKENGMLMSLNMEADKS